MDWYDSRWLDKYLAARDLIARVAPGKLVEFEERLSVLRTDPDFTVRHVKDVLDEQALGAVRQAVAGLDRAQLEMHELKRFGRFVVHDLPFFTELQHSLTERVSEWAGEPVEPSYNFLSLYTQRGFCEPHLDSPSAKWTLDICIDQSAPWPIHIGRIMPWPDAPVASADWQERVKADPSNEFNSIGTLPGEGLLFSGSSQWHYRDPMPAQPKAFCDLLFLHYIPKGAAELIQPRNWAALFGVPELADLPGIERAM
jgi:hypothetical protein